MKKILYLAYYIKNTPSDIYKKFLTHVAQEKGVNKWKIQTDILKSTFKYKISLLDYFYFDFINKNDKERENWAGTGFMYEYQLKMNPKSTRNILEDKIKFLKRYQDFVERKWCSIDKFEISKDLVASILNNETKKIVVKGSKGQIGAEVQVLNSENFDVDSLKMYMTKNNYDLLEDAVVQHSELMKLSPSGLNTVRIITQINKNNEVDVLGARLRVSVNSSVDNLAAGNFAVGIDKNTGVSFSNGVYSDITIQDIKKHPITNVIIKGFSIPNWDMVLDIAKRAALAFPENKSIGWDIAVKEKSVELIEGNHNWCKLLYQLPVNKGLKKELLKYI